MTDVPSHGAEKRPTAVVAAEEAPAVQIRPLDLSGRERQLGEAMLALDRAAQRFCQSARLRLPVVLKAGAWLCVQDPCLVDPASADSSRAETPWSVVSMSAKGGGWARLTLDANAIAVILAGCLGSDVVSNVATAATKRLTVARRALVTKVTRHLADEMARAIEAEVGIRLTVTDSQTVSPGGSMPVLPADGLLVDCVTTELGVDAHFCVAICADALESAVRNEGETHEVTPRDNARVIRAMGDVRVELVAELGRLELGLRRILDLKPGQVLQLDAAAEETCSVRIGSVQKLVGRPVISRGQLAVEITGRHDS